MGLFDLQPYQNPNGSGPIDWDSYKTAVTGGSQSSDSGSIGNDSGQNIINEMANDLNVKLDSTTKDYLMQYYLAERLSQNSFDRELSASSTQYQRAVEDLRKAGLNPFLAFDSLRGSGASSSSGSVSGGLYTQKENSQRERGTKMASGIISILGIIAAAIIAAI